MIAVVGGGVAGLQSAVHLLEKGYEVTLFSIGRGMTPHVAWWGLVPFNWTGNKEQTVDWARCTQAALERFLKEKRPFVNETRWVTLSRTKCESKDFIDELKDFKVGQAAIADLPLPKDHPYVDANSWTTYVIDPKGFLNYLTKRVRKLGGKIVKTEIECIEELAKKYDAVINCKGVSARKEDPNVYPTYGSIVLSHLPSIKNCSILDEDTGGYILNFPGKSLVEVGGIVEPYRFERTLDPQCRQWIVENNQTFLTEELKVEDEWCGLRPSREGGPRVDREGNIISCFGFGGAGFLMSYGYARDVVKLAEGIVRPLQRARL